MTVTKAREILTQALADLDHHEKVSNATVDYYAKSGTQGRRWVPVRNTINDALDALVGAPDLQIGISSQRPEPGVNMPVFREPTTPPTTGVWFGPGWSPTAHDAI